MIIKKREEGEGRGGEGREKEERNIEFMRYSAGKNERG